MTSTTNTLGEALPNEIERCQELLIIYAQIGLDDKFGGAMIKAEIAAANKAMIEGNMVEIIRCYNALKEY